MVFKRSLTGSEILPIVFRKVKKAANSVVIGNINHDLVENFKSAFNDYMLNNAQRFRYLHTPFQGNAQPFYHKNVVNK